MIRLENIAKIYNEKVDDTKALDDVSLEIEKGELVGIIGHTGSGKSTLIQHLNGLLEPHKGNVILDGKNIWTKENRKKIRQVRFAVGLCFQYPEYQIFEEDVYKEIAFGPKQMGLDEAEIDKRIRKSMEFVGLSFDEFSKNDLKSLLFELKAQGKTIIMVSHDLDFVGDIADNVSFLSDGIISKAGGRREVFSSLNFYTTQIRRITKRYLTFAVSMGDIL